MALELHESLFIKNEGNQNEGHIPRACNLLHDKYPQINPEHNLPDPKAYNAATKRIATVANSDKK